MISIAHRPPFPHRNGIESLVTKMTVIQIVLSACKGTELTLKASSTSSREIAGFLHGDPHSMKFNRKECY